MPPLRLVPVVLALGLGACTGGGEPGGDADPTTATGRFGQVHTEVCRAAAQADGGDLSSARATFEDVHVGLHDLATAAGEADRAAAARLLEAKQRVETRLDADTLEALAAPVATAVEATGGTAPDSCG